MVRPGPLRAPTVASALLLVAAGAVPGALLRWILADLRLANLLGSLLIGMIVALGSRAPRVVLFAGVGFCGSLTSYSTWILDLDRALTSGVPAAVVSELAAVPAGLAAVAAGLLIARLAGRLWRAGGRPGFRR